MSYDIVMLDDSGKPSRCISLSVDTHYRLICIAKNKKLSLISRIEEYYTDTIYKVNEINSLRRELELMIDDIEIKDLDIRTFLIDTLSLADEAISQQKPIEGIAD